MGKKNKKQQKMEKIQKRHRGNQEELFMRELDKTSPPTPLGPPNLCAEKERKSARISLVIILPTD